MTEPLRMRETIAGIGVAIDALRAHSEPNAAQVSALAARVTASARHGAGSLPTSARPRTWWLLSLPVVAVLGALGVAALHAWPITRPHSRTPLVGAQRSLAAEPHAASPLVLPPAHAAEAVTKPLPAEVEQIEESASPSTPHARAPRSTPSAPLRARALDPESELSLLRSAQAALGRDAEQALALATVHARDYPSGVFVQERELLAIEALLKLGRREAARTRAKEFVTSFPRSAHVRRLSGLLAPALLAPSQKPESISAPVHPSESKARFR